MTSWRIVDSQMEFYRCQLLSRVKIQEEIVSRLATIISTEVKNLSTEHKKEIANATPVPIDDRLMELTAFQGWMEKARAAHLKESPYVTRAMVITQIYVCFVYLPEACFLTLRKNMPKDSATRKCAKYLTDNPVRSFRNAVAHSNWTYAADFKGLIYWARKGSDINEPIERFTVDAGELDFWQALCRCVAYAVFSSLQED
ncbi:hypothetical protein LXM94_17440 [Rhizobium sp. TRM95111]|uniref:hypothetical protein n=1 Tax=Rhizobium alarense TaxID=2846851 RepID=UPI001F3F3050|nr:hypothetical protein [Rhizobium alarense]MCF3641759.1 hypothetical protein [Rhizobium alarense]